MSISARFDLELTQYDAVNAFVNADLPYETYIEMPRGYRKTDTVLRLQKALYGLRVSPLLWQQELTKELINLGFSQVPHEPCCFKRDGILVFVYVDDLVYAYRPTSKRLAEVLADLLGQRFELSGGGDLQWFLGIEVIRDRPRRLIHLSQRAYIDKISRLTRKPSRVSIPMGRNELLPHAGWASATDLNWYQRVIGSILFAATQTRPDIAFATSRLARFLRNPGPQHCHAADQVLSYLQETRDHALQLGGGDTLDIASDASFADNSLDRKSSQGLAIRLFGGLIAWRANKQDTVTTSTTEAELLALSQAAKEALFLNRLLHELTITLENGLLTIQCDNLQTIRLVNRDLVTLQTKLRHVDIHNHWIRQEVANGRISVVYTPSDEMIADGFTKALPREKWQGFLDVLNVKKVPETRQERSDIELQPLKARS